MTTETTRLRGRSLEIDGHTLVIWTEEGQDRFSAVARDHEGQDIGSATATRSAQHPTTAQLTLRTSPAFRRHGLGRELLGAIVGWAEEAGVEFLVGAAPARDLGVRRFLASSGRPVATRTKGNAAEFAIQAPMPIHAEVGGDAVARALEGGASLAEADTLRPKVDVRFKRHLAA